VISGPPSLTTTQDRLAGIRRGLAESGIEDEIVRSGDFTRDRGARATAELLDADPKITAIFSLNDMMAIGALSVLRARGIRVPDDISVAGFDDIPIASDLWPALSTVRVPMVEMGARALDLALGPHSSNVQIVRLLTDLVLRESTGPALA
jgi:LacI family transcriptional regulator